MKTPKITALSGLTAVAIMSLTAFGCANDPIAATTRLKDQPARDSRYPATWWSDVPRDQAASWEILPQDAGAGEVILSKRTELGVFSNFTEAPFTLDGVSYQALEGFWQMMKYPENDSDPRAVFPDLTWAYTRAQVSQMVSFDAKHAGDLASTNMTKMGIDYVTYQGHQMPYHTQDKGEHYDLIVRATRAKLDQNPRIKELLLRTGDLILKPDHIEDANAGPAWHFYQIWMDLRTELQAQGGG